MRKIEIFQNYDQYILKTYSRLPAIFVKGKGMSLTDIDGRKYLDFFPGWGVSNIGHCHPKVMSAVRDQVQKLIHLPNNLFHPQQPKLAKEIVRWAFPSKVFFCNSGAEACEAAIKFARAYGQGKRYEIISMEKSFHGRTLGALSATGQKKYQKGFSPLVEGFKIIPFNDFKAVTDALSEKTIAIMLELVQGEGGIHVADKEYIKKLRSLCNQKNILLIFDEVQTGMGRTGEMFAFKHYDAYPDIMILAKSLGGGLPIGAMVVKEELANTFEPGMHASTFGGSPLVCKAALGVFKAIRSEKMLLNAKRMSVYIIKKCYDLKNSFNFIKEVRGLGLMIALELNIDGQKIFEDCFQNGLIINCTQKNVLRIMPALNVTKKQIDKAFFILKKSLEKAVNAQ